MGKNYPGKTLLHVITDEDMKIRNANDLTKTILESQQPCSPILPGHNTVPNTDPNLLLRSFFLILGQLVQMLLKNFLPCSHKVSHVFHSKTSQRTIKN